MYLGNNKKLGLQREFQAFSPTTLGENLLEHKFSVSVETFIKHESESIQMQLDDSLYVFQYFSSLLKRPCLMLREKFCVLYVLITLAGMPVSVMEQSYCFLSDKY